MLTTELREYHTVKQIYLIKQILISVASFPGYYLFKTSVETNPHFGNLVFSSSLSLAVKCTLDRQERLAIPGLSLYS